VDHQGLLPKGLVFVFFRPFHTCVLWNYRGWLNHVVKVYSLSRVSN
jgi:hypothetical protein